MTLTSLRPGLRRLGGRSRLSFKSRGFNGNGLAYLLLDEFNDTLAAGAVNGTSAQPGPGTRTVTDGNSKLSIAGGVVSFATGGVGAGDPGLWYASQARVLGKVLLGKVILPATAARMDFGFDATAAGLILDSLRFGATTVLSAVANGTAVVVGVYAAVTYQVALVMRSTGTYYFIKGGAFTNWSLLWQSAVVSAAGLPGIVNETSAAIAFTADNIRVPTNLYTVPCLAYDAFTRADAALGNSETSGPDAQAVTARAWTGTAFAISTNKAVNTPTLGADVIVNGAFAADTDWTKGADWTIAAGVATATAADNSNLEQAAVLPTDHTWISITFTISGYEAGTFRAIPGGSGGFVSHTADGTFTETGRPAGGTTLYMKAVSTFTGNLDNVSVKALTLSELLASLQTSTADVLLDVNVTLPSSTSGLQAGLVMNLDSAASPANFVVAYLNGNGTAILEKCVAGVYTSVISAAVTYSAGAVLRVIKSGTSYSLFYNGAAVGTVQTISDAGIINNTLHGLFSTSALNSLDNFQVFSRGVDNAYSGLDGL